MLKAPRKPKKVRRKIRSAVVTGATGMLGATLVRVLLREGIAVTAVIRPGSKKRGNLPEEAEGLTVVECDLSELRDLTLPKKIDAFFHFAWEGPYGERRNDPELQQQNVRNVMNAVRTAARLGAKVFLGAGSQAEYGRQTGKLTPETPCRPETEYGKAKFDASVLGRALASTLRIDFIWTRILSVYGPFDNDYTLISSAIRSLLKTGRFAATAGEQVWDYLFSEDAAEWFYRLAVCGRGNETYVLGSGEERTLRDYLTELKEVAAPEGEIAFGEIPYREGQVMYLTADIGKTVSDTEYAPKTAFSDGIAKTLDWIRKTPEKG
ncbi:MAG: NAD(P)-dependent oxidoreductase [Lachnospiraceae bacterium]|nr:NAD(P)-dependent oxidoreductase [Lachnospiraceae bacterium]